MNTEFIAIHSRVEVMGPEVLIQRYVDAIKGQHDPSSYMENYSSTSSSSTYDPIIYYCK